MELVVLAAGMGSRFGGNKQTSYVDEHNGFLLDYSIYNAIKSGFNKVVFILNKQSFEDIKQKYSTCLKGIAECEFVIQDNEKILNKFNVNRTKPLGTGYALLCTKDVVKDNFCIINADDYYGKDSFNVASKFLKELDPQSNEFAIIGYQLKNTLSQNGSVKRGVCECDKNGNLKNIVESIVEQKNGKLVATELDGNNARVVDSKAPVSMNMFCFNTKIFDMMQNNFDKFLLDMENLQKKEFLIPTELQNLKQSKDLTMKVLPTTDIWIGMTYQEDKPFVVSELKKLVEKGEFPSCVYKNFGKTNNIEEEKTL